MNPTHPSHCQSRSYFRPPVLPILASQGEWIISKYIVRLFVQEPGHLVVMKTPEIGHENTTSQFRINYQQLRKSATEKAHGIVFFLVQAEKKIKLNYCIFGFSLNYSI